MDIYTPCSFDVWLHHSIYAYIRITMCHTVLLHCYILLLSIDNGYVSFFIKYKRMATILSLE